MNWKDFLGIRDVRQVAAASPLAGAAPLEEYTKRTLATDIAWLYYGTWYRWGGDDPSGYDCSGLAIELLQSVGVLPHKWDATANVLKAVFVTGILEEKDLKPGCLVFWLNDADRATHVEMVIDVVDDEVYLIGASGGGPGVLTMEDAIRKNAFIKVRPLHYRAGRMVYADPFDRKVVA